MKTKPDEIRDDYDPTIFKSGVRGKYTERFKSGVNIVKLDPDVAAVFKTDEQVNEALRRVISSADAAGSIAKH